MTQKFETKLSEMMLRREQQDQESMEKYLLIIGRDMSIENLHEIAINNCNMIVNTCIHSDRETCEKALDEFKNEMLAINAQRK